MRYSQKTEVVMIDLENIKHVHCIGIGGIGLSGLAEILLNNGIKVSGSDMKENDITDRLIEKGAQIYLGHREKNIDSADLLVYSSAVSPDNPEITAAEKKGIPILSRAELLGQLMKSRKYSVAVAGAHGKTTTTSMISLILNKSQKDPTILVGGNLPEIGGNVRVGHSDYFVTEACEYRDSFLELAPRYAIILNIDSDHLDYFSGIEHIVKSFETFANLVPDDGAVIAYDANPFVSSLIGDLDKNIITFGFHDDCDYRATAIEFNHEGCPAFTISHNKEVLCRIQLAVPGEHNIANALAAVACCCDMGIDVNDIKDTLEDFKGTQRRFDLLGETTGKVTIVDDYGHHPTEIRATLSAAKNIDHNNLWCLFQPHTYTRTLALHDDFADALLLADKIVMAEIYAAREKNTHQISSKSIVNDIIKKDSTKDAHYFNNFEEIASFVFNNAGENDLVITMGAGDINKVGQMILDMDKESYLK